MCDRKFSCVLQVFLRREHEKPLLAISPFYVEKGDFWKTFECLMSINNNFFDRKSIGRAFFGCCSPKKKREEIVNTLLKYKSCGTGIKGREACYKFFTMCIFVEIPRMKRFGRIFNGFIFEQKHRNP